MQLKIKHITAKLRAGKKTGVPAALSNSYAVIDTAADCTLRAFISAVCGLGYEGLVRSGKPPESALKMAAAALSSEFASLSGNGRAQAANGALCRIYATLAGITAARAALGAAGLGETGPLLSLAPSAQGDARAAVKAVERKMKEDNVHLKEELKRFEELSGTAGKGRAAVPDYNDQIAAVSKFTGFRIDKNTVMLDEYASYVKQFNLHVNAENRRTGAPGSPGRT